jgi:Cu-processing system permease protein
VNTLRIAWLTFREALRKRALHGALGLTALFLAFYAWGVGAAVRELDYEQARFGGINRIARDLHIDLRPVAMGELLLAGLYAISNIAGLLAIFMAAGTIAYEIERGTLQSIVSKPVGRSQVVLGKWLGGSAMLAAYIAGSGLATAAVVYWRTGYYPALLPAGLALLVVKTALLYSITMVGSAVAPAIATGIAMFIIYVVTNVAGMVEQLGVLTEIETMVRIGRIASFILPSDALWTLGAYLLQPPNPLPALGIKLTLGPFGVVEPPNGLMALYGLAYMALALVLATRLFSRRDL